MEKIITIKSEDKAAFLSRMKKAGHAIDTYQEVEPKIEGEYSIKVTNPEELTIVNNILDQSPKIDRIKKGSTRLKEYLRKLVKEELGNLKNFR